MVLMCHFLLVVVDNFFLLYNFQNTRLKTFFNPTYPRKLNRSSRSYMINYFQLFACIESIRVHWFNQFEFKMLSKKQKRKSAILDDVSSTGCKPAKSEPVSVKPEPEKNDKNPAVSAETVDFDSADILKPKSKSKKKKKQAKEVVKEMEQNVAEEEEEDDLEIVATNQPEEIKIIEVS